MLIIKNNLTLKMSESFENCIISKKDVIISIHLKFQICTFILNYIKKKNRIDK